MNQVQQAIILSYVTCYEKEVHLRLFDFSVPEYNYI